MNEKHNKIGYIGIYPYDFYKINKDLLIKLQNSAKETKILSVLMSALESYAQKQKDNNPQSFPETPRFRNSLEGKKQMNGLRAQIITNLEIIQWLYEEYSQEYDECYEIVNKEQEEIIDQINFWKSFVTKQDQKLYSSAITIIKGGKISSYKDDILTTYESIITEPNETIDEIYLISRCPAESCLENPTKHTWKHTCGEILKIDVKGIIKCDPCNFQCPFVKYLFNCNNHKPEVVYSSAVIKCILSLSENNDFLLKITSAIMGQLTSSAGDDVKKLISDEKDIKEIDLISICPVGEEYNSDQYIWYHLNCEGKIKLQSEWKIKCAKCGKTGNFNECKFKCTKHDLKEPSLFGTLNLVEVLMRYLINTLDIQLARWNRLLSKIKNLNKTIHT